VKLDAEFLWKPPELGRMLIKTEIATENANDSGANRTKTGWTFTAIRAVPRFGQSRISLFLSVFLWFRLPECREQKP